MKHRRTVLSGAEMRHLEFTAAATKALRAGDLKTAERWMRLDAQQFRISRELRAEAERRRQRLYGAPKMKG